MNLDEVRAELLRKGTRLEREAGITPVKLDYLIDTDDFKVVTRLNTEGTRTIIVLYKAAAQNWFFWTPTANQTTQLKTLYNIMEMVDEHNLNARCTA
jgi:hypothetical protein